MASVTSTVISKLLKTQNKHNIIPHNPMDKKQKPQESIYAKTP